MNIYNTKIDYLLNLYYYKSKQVMISVERPRSFKGVILTEKLGNNYKRKWPVSLSMTPLTSSNNNYYLKKCMNGMEATTEVVTDKFSNGFMMSVAIR